MKVIVAGCRKLDDWGLVHRTLNTFWLNNPIDEIVSGGARGADYLGEVWAKKYNVPLTVFEANWDKYGKSAGPIRNEQMAKYGDYLILFWDGVSRGSKNMLDNMKKVGKPYNVVKVILY